jgi:hypothetical protein
MARVTTNSIEIKNNWIQTFKNVNEITVLNYSTTDSLIVVHKDVRFEVPPAQIINSVIVPTVPFVINALGHEIDEVKLEVVYSKPGERAVVNSSQFIKC